MRGSFPYMNQVKLGPLLAGQPGMLLFRHETPRHQPRHELRAINGNRPAGVAWRTREGGFGCPETALPMDASINHAVAPATRVPAPPSPAIRLSRAALAATKTHATRQNTAFNPSHRCQITRQITPTRSCPARCHKTGRVHASCLRAQEAEDKLQIPNSKQAPNFKLQRPQERGQPCPRVPVRSRSADVVRGQSVPRPPVPKGRLQTAQRLIAG